MEDDAIDYYFDDIETFHAELKDILHQPYHNCQDAERLISRYIRFIMRFQHEFVQTTSDLALVAYALLDSSLYLEYSTNLLTHILCHHALSSSNPDELVVVYSILLLAGKEDARWMEYIVSEAKHNKQNRLFRKLLHEIHDSLGGEKLMGIMTNLGFEMCKVSKLRKNDLALITVNYLDYLFNLVENTRGDNEETLNYNVIQLLLVFNEQFMMTPNSDNLVLTELTHRIGTTNTFSANLIFMLNRSDDACVQLLILKLLYGVFTLPALHEYFYTNDLYVLVDIALRELCNLGDERESEALRDAYLRVLRPMLINTQLRLNPYKQNEIYRTLCSLITPCMHKSIDATTKKLVQRILEEWWEDVCKQPIAPVLGVHVKQAVIGSGQGQHAVMKASASSRSSSTSSFSSSPSPLSASPSFLSASISAIPNTPPDSLSPYPTSDDGKSPVLPLSQSPKPYIHPTH
ncbi:uncharacterized protein BYT42DRAFT_583664 [Radiomyces spectabilis]|uniref:uncharacterized protein n=1 Tax=Radiomyces spectabilis TaxID=64574 RepID=UPI00221FAEC3|nr:uncharacterized protein BYT42DRAFT_583664 [Radiomyces spectabilis]KAI8369253.1 hypothetical protein BYT42DRAFT_583664 [Radiomyces spectabilis]